MRILAIWLLPTIGQEIVNKMAEQPYLTYAGNKAVLLFGIFTIILLWLYSVKSYLKKEAAQTRITALDNSFIVELERRDYMMVPMNKEEMAEVRAQNRSIKKVVRAGA